MTHKHSH